MISLVTTLLLGLVGFSHAIPKNLFTMKNLTKQWLEINFVNINSNSWTTATSSFNNFTDPLVFVSLPPVEGATHSDGYPTSIRLQNIHKTVDGFTQFDVKVYLTSDANCTSAGFYTPVPTGNLLVSWAVVERGAFSLENYYFFAFTGSVWRKNSTLTASSTDFVTIPYPHGCTDPSNFNGNCKYQGYLTYRNISAIAQIQTLNNDMFLLTRAKNVKTNSIILLLEPHDSLNLNYYNVKYNETVAVLTFQKNIAIACIEKLSFETAKYHNVTSAPIPYNYIFNDYVYNPGTYGMLLSMNSLVDSTGLRVFDHSKQSCKVITQEDQCGDEESVHTTPEDMGLLIVGERKEASNVVCLVYYNSPVTVNCSTFYLYDLFGDGWGDNVYFQISTHGSFVEKGTTYDANADTSFTSVHNYTLDCVSREITVCSQSAYFEAKVVTVGEPVRFPWEIFWEYEDIHEELWIGDIDSSIGVDNNVVVWYHDLAEYDIDGKNCTQCPPKPPPKGGPGAGPAGPGDNKGPVGPGDDKGPVGPGDDKDPVGPGDDKGPVGSGDDKASAKSAPKPPPAFIDFTLEDADADSWFSPGGWVEPASLSYPDVLVYPRYFITNAEGDELIHEGALCDTVSDFICHEIMPPEGKFIFRVAGYDDDGDIAWDFCGVHGGIGVEVEFEMHHGQCKALQVFTADDLCHGVHSVAVLKGELVLNGVKTATLNEFDTWALEQMLKASFNSPASVSSWALGDNGYLVVTFTTTVTMEDKGYDGTLFDMQDAFFDDMTTSLSTAVEKGFLFNVLEKELQSATVASNDVLRNVQSIELLNFNFASLSFSKGTSLASVVSEPVDEEVVVAKSSSESLLFDAEMGAFVFVAVVLAGFVVVVGAVKFGKQRYQRLSDQSEH